MWFEPVARRDDASDGYCLNAVFDLRLWADGAVWGL